MGQSSLGGQVEATGLAGKPGDGPHVELRLKLEGEIVQAVEYSTNGCPAAYAAALGIATVAKGRTPDQLRGLDSKTLLVLIGGLPEGKTYYADLAVSALSNCLTALQNQSTQAAA